MRKNIKGEVKKIFWLRLAFVQKFVFCFNQIPHLSIFRFYISFSHQFVTIKSEKAEQKKTSGLFSHSSYITFSKCSGRFAFSREGLKCDQEEMR